MAIAKAYGLGMKAAYSGEISFLTDTVKVLLTTSTYTPNQDTHDYLNDVTNEVSGTGYTTGGVTVSGKALNYNTGTNALVLDCDDPVFTTLTVSNIRIAVFYVSTGVSSTSPLLSYVDFAANSSPVGENFTIQMPTAGIIQLTAA